VHQTQRDLPAFLLTSPSLSLSLVLGSSGSTPGSIAFIGNVEPSLDPTAKLIFEKQKAKDLGDGNVVYRAKEEIHHIFRADPKSPPKIITLAFLLAVLAGLGGLFLVVSFPVLPSTGKGRARTKGEKKG
jgi:oligosaccharyltransferase complex subunit delta (ribophorin II)